MNLDFYKGKKVFVTGHTGFKGSWLCKTLVMAGAEVTGFSLEPPTNPNLYSICGINNHINSNIGDISDLNSLKNIFTKSNPEIVFHLAAQPIVRTSYNDPEFTYRTNVMGTVNILECVRHSKTVKSFLNITTDKVYKNNEWEWGYRENDILDGFDPYSNSKSCSDIITSCYTRSFFEERNISISTARAGNVIGGGDYADDRIVPDCIRASKIGQPIIVRNPHSIRPYQHVLEPIVAYLLIAKKQYENKKYSGSYNVGPEDCDCINTGNLVSIFCEKWGNNQNWINKHDGGPHEANFLKLDCSRMKSLLGWKPVWNIDKAIEKVIQWEYCYNNNNDVNIVMECQICEYLEQYSRQEGIL